MKRKTTLLAAGLASALGFTSVAIAADATLYGSVRSGIYHLGSEGSTKASWDLGSVDAGDLGGSGDKLWSRIGVRASHDLGNGMTGGLHIEKRLDNFRTRHQNVYLSGAFGKLTLGQQGTPFHSAVSWDGTNLFGNWTDIHGGSRGSGIQYSSMLDGPFNFAAMIRDDNVSGLKATDCHVDNPSRCVHEADGSFKRDDDGNLVPIAISNGSGGGFDQYELTATYSMADVATFSVGYLGRDDDGADVYGGSVGGSTAGFSWDLGYEKSSEANDQTKYGAFAGYGGAYVFYEDLNTENNMGENHYIVLGYSRSLGTNTWAIVEVQVPDEGRNRTASALRVDF